MALGLGAGVPWVMCQQSDAPEEIVSAHTSLILPFPCFSLFVHYYFLHCTYNFFVWFCRLTPVMDFTVMVSSQILTGSQLFGLKIGMDGCLFDCFAIHLFKLLHFSQPELVFRSIKNKHYKFFYCRYAYWGGRVPHRPVKDNSFAVARFFQRGGSFHNYYMVIFTLII